MSVGDQRIKRLVAEYHYPQAVKLRYDDKSFCWKHYENGRLVYGRGDVPHALYHAEKIPGSGTVFLAEGEKDADTLLRMGLCGVSTEDGASRNGQKAKWHSEYAEQLRGKAVVILNDNDEPGRTHADVCADALLGIAASVRRIEMTDLWDAVPEKGDISDMAAALGLKETKKRLFAAVKRAPLRGGDEDTAEEDPVWTALGVKPLCLGDGWRIGTEGLSRIRRNGIWERFSSTPIVPVAICDDLDSGEREIRLRALVRGRRVEFTAPQRVLSSNQKIVEELAKRGVDVTSNTARYLTGIFSAMLNAAEDIPCVKSVSHLGWVGKDFLPYSAGEVQFAGEDIDRKTCEAAGRQAGFLQEWVDFVAPLRRNLRVRLCMAAGFASPLIALVGAQPFILHLWGTTGVGKTVALRLAMSVWGDPGDEGLMHTTNNTLSSMCITASMLQNIPFAADELQFIKAKGAGNYDAFIMTFCEGIERGRANQNAEKRRQRTWKSCALVTGEEPITEANSGGGAKNRAIELKCTAPLFPDGGAVVSFLRTHHGTAGRRFIEFVQGMSEEELSLLSDIMRERLQELPATDKQKAAAALLLLGDEIARMSLFPGEKPLEPGAVGQFLKSDAEVRTSERAKGFLTDWIAENIGHFPKVSGEPGRRQALSVDEPKVPLYGVLAGSDRVIIIHTVLRNALREEGYNLKAVVDDWISDGFLECNELKPPGMREYYQRQMLLKISSCVEGRIDVKESKPRCCVFRMSADWTDQAERAESIGSLTQP